MSSVVDTALRLLEHAESHNWTPTKWVVGVTALDEEGALTAAGRLTEDITSLFDIPVERSLNMPRNAIRLEAGPK